MSNKKIRESFVFKTLRGTVAHYDGMIRSESFEMFKFAGDVPRQLITVSDDAILALCPDCDEWHGLVLSICGLQCQLFRLMFVFGLSYMLGC